MYSEVFEKWVQSAVEDADIVDELISVKDSPEEISDRFYKELDFGTAGLRGVIGAGTNRMNIYTVGRASQGLADHVNSVTKNGSVAIAYDSRIKSTLFAETAASVLAANGIKVYIYKELMPTPMLSFAVRRLKCTAGIVVTASHNPSQYNGYKVYGEDGCQLPPEAAANIMSIMQRIDCFKDVKKLNFNEALNSGIIEYIGENVIEEYLNEVQKQSINGKSLDMSDFSVIYTPLHGTGNKPVRAILDRIGVKNVTIVKEQELPDGNFPTAPYPNPEIRQPFELALKYAENSDADILLATDPDADRVGIAVRNEKDFTLLTGNDVGVLLLNYILEGRSLNGTLPENPVAVKTVVTTELTQKVADSYGCTLINVLTGFKFIGEQIALLEEKNEENRYILGFEESYGYLPGTYVRDKDAVVASMLICEMAAYYKTKGFTLLEKLEQLYKKHGYYLNKQASFSFAGQSGMKKMAEIMASLRSNSPKTFGGYKIASIDDYKTSVTTDLADNSVREILLPRSDVICFNIEDGSKVIFRPSGTEPKIKLYVNVLANSRENALNKIDAFITDAEQLTK